MLNQEYKPVAAMPTVGTTTQPSIVHAMFHDHDSTLCSKVEALDAVTMIGRVINCAECLAELKKIRQFRSREGTARHQERKAAERAAAPYGGLDQDFVDSMRLRAMALYEIGENALGSILQNAANRVQEYVNEH